MLTTLEASIHIGCQFTLKRGQFILDSCDVIDDVTHLVFTSVNDSEVQSIVDVAPNGVNDPMWKLTQCNNPAEHGG